MRRRPTARPRWNCRRRSSSRGSNITVPVKSDREVTKDELKNHHLLLVGRPDTNSVVARFRAALPVAFGSQSFAVRGETYAHMNSGVIAAAENPLNVRYSLVVAAGMSPASTLRVAPQPGPRRRQRGGGPLPQRGGVPGPGRPGETLKNKRCTARSAPARRCGTVVPVRIAVPVPREVPCSAAESDPLP